MTSRLPRPAAAPARLGAVFALAMFLAGTGAAWAQTASPDVQALLQRIERLQRDMNTLQRQVYRGEAPPAAAPDASATAGAAMEPNLAAAMQVRMDEIESQIRTLTGRLEETNHAVGELTAKLEALSGDIDLRFKSLQAGAAAPAPGASGGPAAAPSGPPPADAAPAKPGVLGTLSLEDAEKKGGAAAQTAAVSLPKGTAEEQYRYATAFLARSDWAGAEKALTAYLQAHPNHALSGNAQYWLGESHYVRGDFGNAALAFAKGYKEFPKSAKGPDNLLKLGLSLANLKKTSSACATFDRVAKDFPDAPAEIKSRAQAERNKLGCR